MISWQERSYWQRRPDQRPVMFQTWNQLAFLHWKVDADWLSGCLPSWLTLDTYQGEAWLGVVPFQMRNIRPAGFPSVPHLSHFLELNVRTYVLDPAGRPGVWFFSLSANRVLAVWAARVGFRLPYYWSSMSEQVDRDGWIRYHCRRFQQPGHARDDFGFRYRPTGTTQAAEPESFAFFLVERYLLFAPNARNPERPFRGQVHHAPYQVQPLEVERCDSQILCLEEDGQDSENRPDRTLPSVNHGGGWRQRFQHSPPPDHALFSPGVDVEVFGLQCDG